MDQILVRLESYQLAWLRAEAQKRCLKMSQLLRIMVEDARRAQEDAATNAPKIRISHTNPLSGLQLDIDDEL